MHLYVYYLAIIFPIWMDFRGGKGLACCAVAMSGAVIFPVLYAIRGGEQAGILALLIVAVVMLYKHIENIQRILQGKEVRVSYLWNREKEMERLNISK